MPKVVNGFKAYFSSQNHKYAATLVVTQRRHASLESRRMEFRDSARFEYGGLIASHLGYYEYSAYCFFIRHCTLLFFPCNQSLLETSRKEAEKMLTTKALSEAVLLRFGH